MQPRISSPNTDSTRPTSVGARGTDTTNKINKSRNNYNNDNINNSTAAPQPPPARVPYLILLSISSSLLIVLLLVAPSGERSSFVSGQANAQELCQSSQLSSFLCKAGQVVLGGAARLAQRVIRRPKHWGVPDDEPLELHDDFHGAPPPGPPPPPPYNGPNHHNNNNNNNQYEPHHLQGVPKKRQRVYCQLTSGSRGVCRPLAACYHRHGSSIKYELDTRQCPGGLSLVCCPKPVGRPSTGGVGGQSGGPDDDSPQSVLSQIQLTRPGQVGGSGPLAGGQSRPQIIGLDALRSIVAQVFQQQNGDSQRANEIERQANDERLWLKKDSPSDLHQRFIQLRNTKLVSKLARDGADFLAVANQIAKNRLISDEQQQQKPGDGGGEREGCRRNKVAPDGTLVTTDDDGALNANCSSGAGSGRQQAGPARRQSLPEIDFSQTELASRCPGDPVCPRSARREPYRTYDGSCNNLRHTAWGKSNTPYARILAPDYEDGIGELRRTGVTGAQLPNARTVSLATVRWSDRADSKATLMLMQWGQFLDHDLSLAATTPMFTPQGASIDCCNRRLLLDARFKHPACISVLLPDNDPFYAKFQVGCMNLVRSAPAPPVGCRLRAREQLNQLTHYIDGSMIYGNDEQQALGLRQFRAGLLKSSRINGMEFLPFDGRVGEGCILPTTGIRRGMRCFVAGDQRVNELTGLVTMHALMLREHNRVARLLALMNPGWSDEKIYQEARRFVVAELQHVTYNEFLPLILGPIIMRDFKLELSQTNAGYSLDYDDQTEPTIVNEFAGAAYRLHSLVQSAFNFQTDDGQLIQQFKLRHVFNNPASLYREGNYDGCIHSMVNEPAQSIDNHFSEEITNHLFQDTNSSFGMDLVTINVQRGRDHGLPGYNFFRQACGLAKLRSFDQLNTVMAPGAGDLFARLYAHVDDIDLFIAGNYEKKLRDAMVGPVFACLIGEQFRRLRAGDRYWFENGNTAGAFTPSQLSELKRTSMARLICDNSETIERIQPLAFLRQANWNPKLPCDQIPWADLRHWQENNLEPFDPFTFRGSREPAAAAAARRLDPDAPPVAPDTLNASGAANDLTTLDDGLD